VVDALDTAAVDAFIASVVHETGSLDIEFNAIGPRISEYGNGKGALDLTIEEFMTSVNTVLRSSFITAPAAARQMRKQGSGVIIFVTGSPARPHDPGSSSIGAAFGAVENLTRSMALELGTAGVRVVCVRTAANSDSRTIQDTTDAMAKLMITGAVLNASAGAVTD
jgi:NAD(P)-dependent dehydrogenase (short-subunit alcohol dehydrogenase family)